MFNTGLVKVLFVSVSVVALPTNVSVAFGNDTVLSPVGSTTVKVVSCASAVAPSKMIVPLVKIPPVAVVKPVTVMVLLKVATAPAIVPPIVILSTQRFAQRTPVLPRSSVLSVSLFMSEPETIPAVVVSKPVDVSVPVNCAEALLIFNDEFVPLPSDTKRKVLSTPSLALLTCNKSPYVSFGERPVKVAIKLFLHVYKLRQLSTIPTILLFHRLKR